MGFSRRKFIFSSVLSTIGIAVLSSPLKHPIKYLISNFDPDLETLLLQARQARLDGNYSLSESLYDQIIQQWPNETRAYFGLRKTFLFQQHKEYDVVRLFEQAVQSNSENVQLICQLAKEYTSIALGNKEVEQMLGYETSLLEMAQDLYNLALSLNSETPPSPFARGGEGTENGFGEGENEEGGNSTQAEVGLEKVENKIDQGAGTVDARDNTAMKAERKANQQAYKNRFASLSNIELQSKLNTLIAKPNPQKRAKHIKELYRLNIKRKKIANDFSGAYSLAYSLHTFDKNDTFSLGLYKRLALKTGQYSQLVTVLKNNDTLQGTFWSKLAYFDALQRLYENSSPSPVTMSKMETALAQMSINFKLTPAMETELSFRKIELEFLKQNNTNVQITISTLVRSLVGSTNVHIAVRFCRSIARYYSIMQQKDIAIKLINNFISNDTLTESDVSNEEQRLIYEYSRNIFAEKQHHLDELYAIRQSLL